MEGWNRMYCTTSEYTVHTDGNVNGPPWVVCYNNLPPKICEKKYSQIRSEEVSQCVSLGVQKSRYQDKLRCARDLLGKHPWRIKLGGSRSWWGDLQTEMRVWHLWKEKGHERGLGEKSVRWQCSGEVFTRLMEKPQSKGFLLGELLTCTFLVWIPPLCSVVTWEQPRKNIAAARKLQWIQRY